MNSGELPHLRLSVLGVIVISLFAALFSRLWYLQVMDSESFKVAAKANEVRLVYDAAPRGRILDRNGAVLVDNRFRFVVTLSRQSATQNPTVVAKTAALLNITAKEVEDRIKDPRFSPYKPVPVAEDVPKELAIYLNERDFDFPGVEVTRVAERVYPMGSLASHVLGYVGQTNADEIKRLRREGYREGDEIGRGGVERAYEDFLRGQPGVRKLAVDASGNILKLPLGPAKAAVPGRDVQLTIDAGVQRLAEESLAQGLEAARQQADNTDEKKKFVAPAGAAVVLDPSDGSVLALASHPTYDPSIFVGGIKQEVFDELGKPENHFPLNDRAIQGQYPPGSTFKLFTGLAALEKGLIDPRTTVDDQGRYLLRNCQGDRCVFQNAGGIKHGKVNLARAVTVSSDVFFYTLGAQFWNGGRYQEAMQETAKSFGLATRTGIPLLGEQPGRVWTPADRRKLHEQRPKDFPEGNWRTGDNINLAIGQGDVAVTPLQLASAYGAFAMGGKLTPPRIAARVLDPQARPVADVPAEPSRQVALPAGKEAMLAGLEGAVRDAKGTAYAAFAGFNLTALPIAGKTGTAEVALKQDTALFVSFGPVVQPRYVVAIVMEEAGFGGSTAAPVARRVWEGLAGAPPGPVTLAGGAAD